MRGYDPQNKAKVLCARVGESLAPPEGSVVRNCNRCTYPITVAPLTFEKIKGVPVEFLCVQCAAEENPHTPLGPMSEADLLQYFCHRGGYPSNVIRTVGEMNDYMRVLFSEGPNGHEARVVEAIRQINPAAFLAMRAAQETRGDNDE